MEKKQFWKALKSGHFASMVRESSKGRCLSSSMEVFNVMKPLYADVDDIERMYCIFLDAKNRIIGIEKMFEGTIMRAIIYPREIIKRVIALKATALVLVHNHISGDPEPSREDKYLTMKMGIALLSMEVTLQDHIIVGDSYYSMADSGYIESIHERINNLIAG